MIERVIGAFNHWGFNLDDTEIADILWLAVQMRRCDLSPMSELPQETPAVTPEIDPNTKLPRDRQNNSPKSPTKTETNPKVYPQSSQDSNETSSGLPIKVPAAQALRNKLDISRFLKPLKRRVPSRSEFILDEIATAECIAEEKLLLPVMRPAPERWLELALVVDEGTSMFLWQQTIKEFQQLLERHGAFRDVRTWGLFSDERGKVWLRPRTGELSRQKRLHNPRELIDPNGQLTKGLARIGNPQKLMEAILSWTGGQPFLTQKLCSLAVKSNIVSPSNGYEAHWIEDLVRSGIIKDWEDKDEPEHLKTIRDRILVFNGSSENLLRLYSNRQGG